MALVPEAPATSPTPVITPPVADGSLSVPVAITPEAIPAIPVPS